MRPGELSCAHHGVLFLDELGEFPSDVLDTLRQPLEEGRVLVCRARASVSFPARVLLVAAMNPCPCGSDGGPGSCRCSPAARHRYAGRVSGPLLDRFDLRVGIDRPDVAELLRIDGGPVRRRSRPPRWRPASRRPGRWPGGGGSTATPSSPAPAWTGPPPSTPRPPGFSSCTCARAACRPGAPSGPPGGADARRPRWSGGPDRGGGRLRRPGPARRRVRGRGGVGVSADDRAAMPRPCAACRAWGRPRWSAS